jgi:hypothetical protein
MTAADDDRAVWLCRAYKAADVSGDGFIGRLEFRRLLHYIVYFNNLWHLFAQVVASPLSGEGSFSVLNWHFSVLY